MDSSPFAVQVDTAHYDPDQYDDYQRFVSYFFQIDLVRRTRPESVLEIGIGNKTVTNYLRNQMGLAVTACDFDQTLEPDVVADIRDLPFSDDQFDTVLACEILEHIQFADVPQALSELARVARRHVIISIPYSGICVEAIGNLSLVHTFGRTLRLPIRIPYFLSRRDIQTINPEHYWELGRRGYSKGMVRTLLNERFAGGIEQEFHPPLDPYHCFFLLKA